MAATTNSASEKPPFQVAAEVTRLKLRRKLVASSQDQSLVASAATTFQPRFKRGLVQVAAKARQRAVAPNAVVWVADSRDLKAAREATVRQLLPEAFVRVPRRRTITLPQTADAS